MRVVLEMLEEWCLATKEFWVLRTWGSTLVVGKGNDVLEPVSWVARRRKRGAASELEIR